MLSQVIFIVLLALSAELYVHFCFHFNLILNSLFTYSLIVCVCVCVYMYCYTLLYVIFPFRSTLMSQQYKIVLLLNQEWILNLMRVCHTTSIYVLNYFYIMLSSLFLHFKYIFLYSFFCLLSASSFPIREAHIQWTTRTHDKGCQIRATES